MRRALRDELGTRPACNESPHALSRSRAALAFALQRSKVRIAVVAKSEQVVGGAENYIRWMMQALAQEGHDLGFAYQYPAIDPERAITASPGVKLWDLSRLGDAEFHAELRAFAPDLVFLQGLDDVEREGKLIEHFDVVLFAHDYWGSCLTGSRTHTAPAREICTKRFGPACLGLNYARGCGTLSPVRAIRQYRDQTHRLSHLPSLAALVVASRHMRLTYERQGVPSENIHVLPCPPSGIEADPEPPLPKEFTHELLFLGRLTKVKGVTHAIRATALASSMLGWTLSLSVAGDGPLAEECRELALRFGVSLKMRGWVDGAERVALLRRVDALVVSSLWPEPFGMVGLEGGCVGLPSVAYDVGGVRDWLLPGESGELAPPFDVGELARGIVRALASESHYHVLRVGAWKRASTMTPRAHLASLLSVFERTVAVARDRRASGRPERTPL